METQLTTNNQNEIMTSQDAQHQFEDLKRFISAQLEKDTDYGLIPGTKKPSLWKPGAEKLLFFHGLGARVESTPNTILDWKSLFFNYEFKCSVYSRKTGTVYAESIGSANSKESKFAFRWVDEKKVPLGYEKDKLEVREGNYGRQYRVPIPESEIPNLSNTLLKLAQKRAMVAATLIACRAGFFFGQDLEEDDAPPAKEERIPVDNQEQSPAEFNGNLISQAQVKLIYALVKKGGVSSDAISNWLKTNLPYTTGQDGLCHLGQIKKSDMDGLVKFLSSFGPQGM